MLRRLASSGEVIAHWANPNPNPNSNPIQAIFGRSISANLTRKVPTPDIRYYWLNFKARAVAELNHQSGLARTDAATAAVLAKVTACERHFYERAWAHHRACVLPIEQCTAHAH